MDAQTFLAPSGTAVYACTMLAKLAWLILLGCVGLVVFDAVNRGYAVTAAAQICAQQFRASDLRQGCIDRTLNQPNAPAAPVIFPVK